MSDLASLRRTRAAKASEIAAMTFGANSTDEELAAFETANADLARMDRAVIAAERQHAINAQTAQAAQNLGPLGQSNQPQGQGLTVAAQAAEPHEPGINFCRMSRALLVAKGNPSIALNFAVSTWGERHAVTQEIGAAMQTNDGASGGFLVPEKFSAEVIDLLMPMTVMRRNISAAGGVVPLVGGTDSFPTVESGTTAYYVGEGRDATASEPKFGNMKLTEREIVALVPISNKLLRHASVQVDRMVRSLITRGMAQTEDLALMRGTGVGGGPKGLRFAMNTANVIASNATVNVTNIDTDARKAELALAQSDIPMIDVKWMMPWKVFTFLRDFRDANSNLVWPSLSLPSPTWKGYPVETTNNVPNNLGGGADSEVYLVAFGHLIIADSFAVRLDASESASYADGGGLVSAFSRNQTVLKATAGHDFGMARNRAAVCLTDVKWGA